MPFLVSEPEEIIIDHDHDHDHDSLYNNNEIFYTPNEEIRSYPTSSPYRHFSRKNSEIFNQNNISNVFSQKKITLYSNIN